MKQLSFYLFLLPLTAFSQTTLPLNSDGKYEYTDIVNVDSAAAAKLYSNAKIFLVSAFKSSKAATQLSDDESKTVAGTGSTGISFSGLNGAIEQYVRFKFLIQCKDGRYKYVINTFEFLPMARREFPLEDEKQLKHYATKRMKTQIFEQVDAAMKKLIVDMKASMASEAGNTKDW